MHFIFIHSFTFSFIHSLFVWALVKSIPEKGVYYKYQSLLCSSAPPSSEKFWEAVLFLPHLWGSQVPSGNWPFFLLIKRHLIVLSTDKDRKSQWRILQGGLLSCTLCTVVILRREIEKIVLLKCNSDQISFQFKSYQCLCLSQRRAIVWKTTK